MLAGCLRRLTSTCERGSNDRNANATFNLRRKNLNPIPGQLCKRVFGIRLGEIRRSSHRSFRSFTYVLSDNVSRFRGNGFRRKDLNAWPRVNSFALDWRPTAERIANGLASNRHPGLASRPSSGGRNFLVPFGRVITVQVRFNSRSRERLTATAGRGAWALPAGAFSANCGDFDFPANGPAAVPRGRSFLPSSSAQPAMMWHEHPSQKTLEFDCFNNACSSPNLRLQTSGAVSHPLIDAHHGLPPAEQPVV